MQRCRGLLRIRRELSSPLGTGEGTGGAGCDQIQQGPSTCSSSCWDRALPLDGELDSESQGQERKGGAESRCAFGHWGCGVEWPGDGALDFGACRLERQREKHAQHHLFCHLCPDLQVYSPRKTKLCSAWEMVKRKSRTPHPHCAFQGMPVLSPLWRQHFTSSALLSLSG